MLGLASSWAAWAATSRQFNRTAASANASQMALAAIGLVIPAVFVLHLGDTAKTDAADPLECELSIGVAVMLLLAYVAQPDLLLRTHAHLYSDEEKRRCTAHAGSVRHSVDVLAGATLVRRRDVRSCWSSGVGYLTDHVWAGASSSSASSWWRSSATPPST